ncbi:hypothetical protein Pla123a_24160 [Posidoniimonas polymericola]|uniref:PEP-CTERM protein-sorting domain-containing protein n=1 Tax=Posidoniimonas polymericola TaxID=2528002 RepID=A0A5C5YPV9_9BACT|nr:PEP-CTERM sorting domain-containing protein [Posidoniimonas polymericola]TWT76991.1 hypothetical protein Pla123a_24160 [Posidoniimonas polymericola]
MKLTFHYSTLLAAALVVAAPLSVDAGVLGADDFSEGDGALLNGKTADVGGVWAAPDSGQIQGGAYDTAQFGDSHQGAFVDFSGALAAGETLTMTFETLATAGDMFSDGVSGNSYAGISLYVGGDEKFFVGDPAGGNDVLGTGWTLDGFAGGSGVAISAIGSEAVSGVFTYHFDSGNASLTVDDGVTSDTIFRTYDPGVAINRLRIQAGDGAAEINVASFSVSSDVPEPASLSLLGFIAVGGVAARRWKR